MGKAIRMIKESKHAAVLTGAGISTLSGPADFRGEYNPIRDKYPHGKIFDIDYFRKDPQLFYDFPREVLAREYRPNIARLALK
ncbi:MAG: hypothetical protein LLG37_10945 [Spirochaetia bacterium]|nr:hypothetical protein [Spirochaetia bacterium]